MFENNLDTELMQGLKLEELVFNFLQMLIALASVAFGKDLV
jgi:hypothetical protein